MEMSEATAMIELDQCMSNILVSENFIIKQDSPPAGNRKRSTAHAVTYPSITCPGGGGGEGYPTLSWTEGALFVLEGVTHPVLDGGIPPSCPGGGPPPCHDLCMPWDWGSPPPQRDLGPVTGEPPPWKGYGTGGSIMGWRWGTPPPSRL